MRIRDVLEIIVIFNKVIIFVIFFLEDFCEFFLLFCKLVDLFLVVLYIFISFLMGILFRGRNIENILVY